MVVDVTLSFVSGRVVIDVTQNNKSSFTKGWSLVLPLWNSHLLYRVVIDITLNLIFIPKVVNNVTHYIISTFRPYQNIFTK